MSLRRPAKEQPDNFDFNSTSLAAAEEIIKKYPKDKQQSAVMAFIYIMDWDYFFLDMINYKNTISERRFIL